MPSSSSSSSDSDSQSSLSEGEIRSSSSSSGRSSSSSSIGFDEGVQQNDGDHRPPLPKLSIRESLEKESSPSDEVFIDVIEESSPAEKEEGLHAKDEIVPAIDTASGSAQPDFEPLEAEPSLADSASSESGSANHFEEGCQEDAKECPIEPKSLQNGESAVSGDMEEAEDGKDDEESDVDLDLEVNEEDDFEGESSSGSSSRSSGSSSSRCSTCVTTPEPSAQLTLEGPSTNQITSEPFGFGLDEILKQNSQNNTPMQPETPKDLKEAEPLSLASMGPKLNDTSAEQNGVPEHERIVVTVLKANERESRQSKDREDSRSRDRHSRKRRSSSRRSNKKASDDSPSSRPAKSGCCYRQERERLRCSSKNRTSRKHGRSRSRSPRRGRKGSTGVSRRSRDQRSRSRHHGYDRRPKRSRMRRTKDDSRERHRRRRPKLKSRGVQCDIANFPDYRPPYVPVPPSIPVYFAGPSIFAAAAAQAR